MKTPSPTKGEGTERCLSGDGTLSNSLTNAQHLCTGNSLSILVDDCVVRVVGIHSALGVRRRQSFAWASDARAYAERLRGERGWSIEVSRGD